MGRVAAGCREGGTVRVGIVGMILGIGLGGMMMGVCDMFTRCYGIA